MDVELAKSFSREELESMGEEVQPETTTPGPETPAAEVKAEAAKAEPIPEPEPKAEVKDRETTTDAEAEPEPKEGESVPYIRFAKVYGQAKQTEREREEYKEKLDLFKRDPGEYYVKFPDEKPDDWQPAKAAEPVPAKVLTYREMLGARVNDPKNPGFHGRTLTELMADGPEGIAAASDYYQEYVESVRGKVQEAKAKEESTLNQMREEDNKFMAARATELFGKPMSDLDEIQKDKINGVVKETLAWMKKNGRMAYKLDDAYKVMHYDDAINGATEKGAKALVDRAKAGTVRNVNAGPSGEKSSDPYAAFLGMSEESLIDKIRDMPDAKYDEFLKKASPAFKQKFPSLPYPD